MVARHVSKQSCEYPRKLFNTWLNCLQVKWQWNSQAVNLLNRSRCWECDREGLRFHRRMRGDCTSVLPHELCVCSVVSVSSQGVFWGDFCFSQNNSPCPLLLIKTYLYKENDSIVHVFSSPHWRDIFLFLHSSKLPGDLKQCMSACKGLQYNAHLLVMAMDYFIVFCLWSALIAFPLLRALCNVICPLRLRHPFYWAVLFNIHETLSQPQNRSLKSYSQCQHRTVM